MSCIYCHAVSSKNCCPKSRQDDRKLPQNVVNILTELRGIIDSSDGVAGYHLNGDLLSWAETELFDEINEVLLTQGIE